MLYLATNIKTSEVPCEDKETLEDEFPNLAIVCEKCLSGKNKYTLTADKEFLVYNNHTKSLSKQTVANCDEAKPNPKEYYSVKESCYVEFKSDVEGEKINKVAGSCLNFGDKYYTAGECMISFHLGLTVTYGDQIIYTPIFFKCIEGDKHITKTYHIQKSCLI